MCDAISKLDTVTLRYLHWSPYCRVKVTKYIIIYKYNLKVQLKGRLVTEFA